MQDQSAASTGVVFPYNPRFPEPKRENPDTTLPDDRVKLTNKFYSDSNTHKVRTEAVKWWQEADRLYNGDHWSDSGKMEAWRAKLVSNLVYPIVEKYLSIIIDKVPEIEIAPREPEDHVIAKSIDRYFAHEWEQKNWISTIGMAIEKAIIRNIGFLKVFWDVHSEGGRGGPHISSVSAYDLYLHPDAVIRDGQIQTKYAIHRFRMTREQIIAKYNVDTAKPPEPQQAMSFMGGRPQASMMGSPEVGGTRSISGSSSTSQNPNKQENPQEGYDIFEMWYMDDSRVETAEFDPTDQRTTAPVKPLHYPNGRIITMSNNMILYDGPNQLGFFPFIALTPAPDDERIYRKSMINHIASPQLEYNKRRSQLADHASHSANPMIEISVTSNISADTPLNQPGRKFVNRTPEIPGIRVIEMPKLGPEITQAMMMAHQDVQEISGIYEVNRGKDPAGDQSGVALERLQNEGESRTNMRMLFVDQGLKQLVRCIVSMFLDFISDERKFAFIGDDAQFMFESFNPIQQLLPRRMGRIMEIESMIMQLQQDMQFATMESAGDNTLQIIQQRIQNLEREIQIIIRMPAHDLVSLDIKISMGTRTMSQTAKAALAVQLHQTPSSSGYGTVFDDQALLEFLEIPGWQEIMARQQAAAAIIAEEMEKMQKAVRAEEQQALKKAA